MANKKKKKSKKKQNKQPAQKRNRGTLIDFSNREMPKVEEEKCEEIIKRSLIKGNIKDYDNNTLFIEYENNKEISCEIENNFLNFSKEILFAKKFNKKEGKEKVTIIYIRLLPKDLQDIEVENFSLKINHFPIVEIKDKNEIKFHYQDKYCLEYDNKIINNYYKAITNLKLLNKKSFTLKTNYRLVIGSEQSIYETSIRLHHIYGIPYIPASAIKGVVRSYYILEKFANKLEEYKDRYNKFEEEILFKKEDGKYKEKWFVDIFGSQEQEGKIIFFDAFPINKPKIKVDIMTPHYGDYYKDKDNKKKIAPTDNQDPNPIPFLTVEETEFKFFIASKESLESFKIKDKSIEEWFKKALQNHGIGGKSAVGYGYLEEIKE